MAPLDGFEPYVRTARRYLFLREREAARRRADGAALAFRARRLAAYSAPLPADCPARGALLAAGVLALEEVRGASVDELRAYGLTRGQAEALITRIETDPELAVPTTFLAGPRAGRPYDQDEVVLLASAPVTSGGAGDAYELGDRGTLRLALDVTALAAGAELRAQVETRAASSDPWRPIGSFAPARAVAPQFCTVAGCDRYVRVLYGLTGASATFSVTGTAV